MGIDAEMFVRRTGTPLTETEVRQVAARMCSVIGAENFFLFRPGEWGEVRGHHALSVCPTVAEARKEAAEYGDSSDFDGEADTAPAWTQDGPPIIGAEGEQFLKVNFMGWYYGPGYERGNWPIIRATAEFLEMALPGSEVWYGGDSSGVLAERLDAAAREKMTAHYLANGHAPYRGSFGGFGSKAAQTCEFCAGFPMYETGGGGNKTFWWCDGCGLQRVTIGAKAYDLKKGQNFFGFEPPTEDAV